MAATIHLRSGEGTAQCQTIRIISLHKPAPSQARANLPSAQTQRQQTNRCSLYPTIHILSFVHIRPNKCQHTLLLLSFLPPLLLTLQRLRRMRQNLDSILAIHITCAAPDRSRRNNIPTTQYISPNINKTPTIAVSITKENEEKLTATQPKAPPNPPPAQPAPASSTPSAPAAKQYYTC